MPRFWYVRGLSLDQAIGAELQREGRVERWGHRASVQLRDDPDEVQTVLDGRLSLTDGEFEARPLLTQGDVFGLVTPDEQAGELHALDDLKIVTVRRDFFEELLRERAGELAANVGLVRRTRLSVPVESLWYSTPRHRVAKLLLRVIEAVGRTSDGIGTLDFVPRTKILARLSGLAEPTVSAIVEDMQRHQIVAIHRGRMDASLEMLRAIAIE